ncbi:hypothetical protein Bbelb_313110 [Branchiostoma belcheri]|nr:hypothetical protein Bbelb_313110 [Branchiostoma belcheri]
MSPKSSATLPYHLNNKLRYVIDPDGHGRGVLPMLVQCDLEKETAITLIGHDSEARTHVKGFEKPGSYSKDVTYWNSMEQVRAVVDQSSSCKQYLKYECFNSHLWDNRQTHQWYSWWVTWDGRQADYWGGASPESGKCACGEAGKCRSKFNCDANDLKWREDSGFLSHKNDLPVTQLRFGDTGGYGHKIGGMSGLEPGASGFESRTLPLRHKTPQPRNPSVNDLFAGAPLPAYLGRMPTLFRQRR